MSLVERIPITNRLFGVENPPPDMLGGHGPRSASVNKSTSNETVVELVPMHDARQQYHIAERRKQQVNGRTWTSDDDAAYSIRNSYEPRQEFFAIRLYES